MTLGKTYYVHRGIIRDNNDCAIRALEFCTGISHREARAIAIRYGFSSEGLTLLSTISALWDATDKKPIVLARDIKGLTPDKVIKGRTGIVFVDQHAIGVKDGIASEPIQLPITCVAWI